MEVDGVLNKTNVWEAHSFFKYYRHLMLTARDSQYCYESKYIKTFVFILDMQLKVYLPFNDYSPWDACFIYVRKKQKCLFVHD